MADSTEGYIEINKPVMTSFPQLFEAKAVMRKGKPTGEPKFSANFEFHPVNDKAELDALKAKAAAVAKAKWPGRDLKELAFPFTSGDKLADKAKAKGKDREWSRGLVVLTSRSKFQPQLSIFENGKIIDLDSDVLLAAHKSKFYNGVQTLAQVNFVAYDAVDDDGKAGVTAYLNKVLSINKGAKLSGGASAAETFKGYVGLASDEDPTAGASLDDEIPF